MRVTSLDRRRFLAACAAAGAGGLFPGALLALASRAAEAAPAGTPVAITEGMIGEAARLAGIDIPVEARAAMLDSLGSAVGDYEAIRKLRLANDVAPAFEFRALLGASGGTRAPSPIAPTAPAAGAAPTGLDARTLSLEEEDLAYASVAELGALLRAGRVTAVRLAELSLARLRRLDPVLRCVVTLTEDRALRQARQADAELASGGDRGPLHGIPWGAKDILAVAGHPTTWGARGFETQSFDQDASVVRLLDRAGAVLVAKLSVGALAMGDLWFGGRTRNPWRPEQGSSGSSAGSAAAVAAGCVPFAIGTETLGSISSPATRCGVTGLRPTFGRVSSDGAMALSWTMDKIGPLARSAEDALLVLRAIADAEAPLPPLGEARSSLRVGVLRTLHDATDPAVKAARVEAITVLRRAGHELRDVSLPDLPWSSMLSILLAEAAAAFDDLTRSGADRRLDGQEPDDWPNLFRVSRFIPAVEYVQASRARRLGCEAMTRFFEDVDVVLAPTDDAQLLATNLAGTPAVIVPAGLRAPDAPVPAKVTDAGGPGTPVSVTFLAGAGREVDACRLAREHQLATSHHRARPRP